MNKGLLVLGLGGAAAIAYFATRKTETSPPTQEQCNAAISGMSSEDKTKLLTVLAQMKTTNEPANNQKNAATLRAFADSIQGRSPVAAECIRTSAVPAVLAGNYS